MANARAVIDIDINASPAAAELRRLQAQINGFSAALNKANTEQGLAVKGISRQLSDLVNSSKFFTAETVRMRTSAAQLDDTLKKGQGTMGQFFSARFRKDGLAAAQVLSLANARASALETQFIQTGAAAGGMKDALAIRPLQAFNSAATVSAQKLAIHRAMLQQATTSMINFGKNTQWAGRQLMVGFTVPLTIFGGLAAKTFRELEEQAINFKKVYGDIFTTDEETQAALENVQELSKEFTKYGIAVKDTMALAGVAAQSGLRNAELMAATTQATRLATLGQMEQADAMKTIISLQTAFKASNEELAESVDFLNIIENQTVLSLQDVAGAIPRVAPVIQGLGGDVKDLAVLLVAMKEGGVSAGEGANALKSSLGRLITPTKRAKEMAQEFGINLDQIVQSNRGQVVPMIQELATAMSKLGGLEQQQLLSTIFGKFQYARIGALFKSITDDSSQAARAMGLINMSAEELAKTAEKELLAVEQGIGTKMTAAMERLKVAIAPIGEMFLKMATPIINFLAGIAEKFNNLPDFAKKFIGLATVITGLVIPAGTMFLGLLMNLVGTLIKFGHIVGIAFKGFMSGGIKGAFDAVSQAVKYMSLAEIDASNAAQQLAGTTQAVNAALLDQVSRAEGSTAAIMGLAGAYDILVQNMRESMLIGGLPMAVPGQAGMRAGRSGLLYKPLPIVARNKGGSIPYLSEGGTPKVPGVGNTDTVPAMLTPGEFVVNKQATQENLGLLHAINDGNVQYRNKGGGIAEMGRKFYGPRPNPYAIAAQEARQRLEQFESSRSAIAGLFGLPISGVRTQSRIQSATSQVSRARRSQDIYDMVVSGDTKAARLLKKVVELGISPERLGLKQVGNLVLEMSPSSNMRMANGNFTKASLLSELSHSGTYSPLDHQLRRYFGKSLNDRAFDEIYRQQIALLPEAGITNQLFEKATRNALRIYMDQNKFSKSQRNAFIRDILAPDTVRTGLRKQDIRDLLNRNNIDFNEDGDDIIAVINGERFNFGDLAGRSLTATGRAEGLSRYDKIPVSKNMVRVHANKGGMIPGVQYLFGGGQALIRAFTAISGRAPGLLPRALIGTASGFKGTQRNRILESSAALGRGDLSLADISGKSVQRGHVVQGIKIPGTNSEYLPGLMIFQSPSINQSLAAGNRGRVTGLDIARDLAGSKIHPFSIMLDAARRLGIPDSVSIPAIQRTYDSALRQFGSNIGNKVLGPNEFYEIFDPILRKNLPMSLYANLKSQGSAREIGGSARSIGRYIMSESSLIQSRNEGGEIFESANKTIVPGIGNTDTVPAVLTPGEFVVNKQATQANKPLLQAINSGQPVEMNMGGQVPGVQYLRVGGIARSLMHPIIALKQRSKRNEEIYFRLGMDDFTSRQDMSIMAYKKRRILRDKRLAGLSATRHTPSFDLVPQSMRQPDQGQLHMFTTPEDGRFSVNSLFARKGYESLSPKLMGILARESIMRTGLIPTTRASLSQYSGKIYNRLIDLGIINAKKIGPEEFNDITKWQSRSWLKDIDKELNSMQQKKLLTQTDERLASDLVRFLIRNAPNSKQKPLPTKKYFEDVPLFNKGGMIPGVQYFNAAMAQRVVQPFRKFKKSFFAPEFRLAEVNSADQISASIMAYRRNILGIKRAVAGLEMASVQGSPFTIATLASRSKDRDLVPTLLSLAGQYGIKRSGSFPHSSANLSQYSVKLVEKLVRKGVIPDPGIGRNNLNDITRASSKSMIKAMKENIRDSKKNNEAYVKFASRSFSEKEIKDSGLLVRDILRRPNSVEIFTPRQQIVKIENEIRQLEMMLQAAKSNRLTSSKEYGEIGTRILSQANKNKLLNPGNSEDKILVEGITKRTSSLIQDAGAMFNRTKAAGLNKGGFISPTLRMNDGNMVPGVGNTDTVPAMLTPGEFVVNQKAAQDNLPLLHAINGGQVQFLNEGGSVVEDNGKYYTQDKDGNRTGGPYRTERAANRALMGRRSRVFNRPNAMMGGGMGMSMGLGMAGMGVMSAGMLPGIRENETMATATMAGGIGLSLLSVLPMLGVAGPAIAAIAGIGIVAGGAVLAIKRKMEAEDEAARKAAEFGANLGRTSNALKDVSSILGVATPSERIAQVGSGLTDQAMQDAANKFSNVFQGSQFESYIEELKKSTSKERFAALSDQMRTAIASGMLTKEDAQEFARVVGTILNDPAVGAGVATAIAKQAQGSNAMLQLVEQRARAVSAGQGMRALESGERLTGQGGKEAAEVIGGAFQVIQEAANAEALAREEYAKGTISFNTFNSVIERARELQNQYNNAIGDALVKTNDFGSTMQAVKDQLIKTGFVDEDLFKKIDESIKAARETSIAQAAMAQSGGQPYFIDVESQTSAGVLPVPIDMADPGMIFTDAQAQKLGVEYGTTVGEFLKNVTNSAEDSIIRALSQLGEDLPSAILQNPQAAASYADLAKRLLTDTRLQQRYGQFAGVEGVTASGAMDATLLAERIATRQVGGITFGGDIDKTLATLQSYVQQGGNAAAFETFLANIPEEKRMRVVTVFEQENQREREGWISDFTKIQQLVGEDLATEITLSAEYRGSNSVERENIINGIEEFNRLPAFVEKSVIYSIETNDGKNPITREEAEKSSKWWTRTLKQLGSKDKTIRQSAELAIASKYNGEPLSAEQMEAIRGSVKNWDSLLPESREEILSLTFSLATEFKDNGQYADLGIDAEGKTLQQIKKAVEARKKTIEGMIVLAELKGFDASGYRSQLQLAEKAIADISQSIIDIDSIASGSGTKPSGSSGAGGGGGQKSILQQLKDQFQALKDTYNAMEKYISSKTGVFKDIAAGPFGPQFIEFLKSQGEEGLKILKGDLNKFKQVYNEYLNVQMQSARNVMQNMPQAFRSQGMQQAGTQMINNLLENQGFSQDNIDTIMGSFENPEALAESYAVARTRKRRGKSLTEQQKEILKMFSPESMRKILTQAQNTNEKIREEFVSSKEEALNLENSFRNTLEGRNISPEVIDMLIEMGYTSKDLETNLEGIVSNAQRLDSILAQTKFSDSMEGMNQEIDQANFALELMGRGIAPEAAAALSQIGNAASLSNEEIQKFVEKFKELEILRLAMQDPAELRLQQLQGQESINQLKYEIELLENINKNETMSALYAKENVDNHEDLLEVYERENEAISRTIELEQRKLEPIDEAIDKYQEQISKIEEHYDKQLEALDKVQEKEAELEELRQGQLDVAAALSRGDVAGAAQAAVELRRQFAQQRREDTRKAIEKARQDEIDAIQEKINEKQEERKAIEEQIKRLQLEQRSIQDQIYNTQFIINSEAAKLEDKYKLGNNQLAILKSELAAAEAAQNDLNDAIARGNRTRQEGLTDVPAPADPGGGGGTGGGTGGGLPPGIIPQSSTYWDTTPGQRGLKYISNNQRVTGKVQTGSNTWAEYSNGNRTGVVGNYMYGGSVNYRGSREVAPGMMMGGKVNKYAFGSFVPGTGMTDKVPAMLTPGEFVVRKPVAQKFGPMLERMNSQVFPGMGPQLSPPRSFVSQSAPRAPSGSVAPRNYSSPRVSASMPSSPATRFSNATTDFAQPLSKVASVGQKIMPSPNIRMAAPRSKSFSVPKSQPISSTTAMAAAPRSSGGSSGNVSYNNPMAYNYSITVNAQSVSSADDIASTVIAKIKNLGDRQIRGVSL